jgi:8-oxo-dGTP diphosphatase
MIEVCCAIIVDGIKILAVQRGPESSHPWLWEFPGGKVRPGETHKRCVIREIGEELTLKVDILHPLGPVKFNYGTKQIRLIPFVCRIVSGEITLTEHTDMRWFLFDEWDTIDWLGADRELILKNGKNLNRLLFGGAI